MYVCPVCLSVSRLSVCLVTLVYCGQTAGWIKNQDATLYGSRPHRRPHCVRWGPSFPYVKRHSSPPTFRPTLLLHGRPSQQLLSSCSNFGVVTQKMSGFNYLFTYNGQRKRPPGSPTLLSRPEPTIHFPVKRSTSLIHPTSMIRSLVTLHSLAPRCPKFSRHLHRLLSSKEVGRQDALVCLEECE